MSARTVMPHALTQGDAEWLSTPSTLAQGVSLAKTSDLPSGVVMIASAGQEDYLARMRVDVAHGLPIGQREGLDCNNLRALSRVFHTLARRGA